MQQRKQNQQRQQINKARLAIKLAIRSRRNCHFQLRQNEVLLIRYLQKVSFKNGGVTNLLPKIRYQFTAKIKSANQKMRLSRRKHIVHIKNLEIKKSKAE